MRFVEAGRAPDPDERHGTQSAGRPATTRAAGDDQSPEQKLIGTWIAKDVDVTMGEVKIKLTFREDGPMKLAAWSDIPFAGQVRDKKGSFEVNGNVISSQAIHGGTSVEFWFEGEDLLIKYKKGKSFDSTAPDAGRGKIDFWSRIYYLTPRKGNVMKNATKWMATLALATSAAALVGCEKTEAEKLKEQQTDVTQVKEKMADTREEIQDKKSDLSAATRDVAKEAREETADERKGLQDKKDLLQRQQNALEKEKADVRDQLKDNAPVK